MRCVLALYTHVSLAKARKDAIAAFAGALSQLPVGVCACLD
jgi:hypothetical protein